MDTNSSTGNSSTGHSSTGHSSARQPHAQRRIWRKYQLATPGSRLIAYILDAAIFAFTLGVGWIIWLLILRDRGTTPGHDLMGHQIVKIENGQLLTLKEIVIRELLVKGILIWVVASLTYFLAPIANFALIFREGNRTGHDFIMGSEVVQSR